MPRLPRFLLLLSLILMPLVAGAALMSSGAVEVPETVSNAGNGSTSQEGNAGAAQLIASVHQNPVAARPPVEGTAGTNGTAVTGTTVAVDPPGALANEPQPILDPNRTPYPSSSLNDFSDLQDAPAGKNGFLMVHGDHFYWKNGMRARFWGINIANSSLQESDADIDAMMHNFRTAGFNLIRLHHFDERDGIIDLNANDSRHFQADRLKKLDYWIYKARENGIYVYLDLLDYRQFKPGDGVANAEAIGRSAKPYAVFDRRLIELQKEYAYKLLRDHVNPYTGLAYADDPTVVVVEIYDENGLFMRRALWRSMPEPYETEFRGLWNDWLRERYKDTATLKAAWTDAAGRCALMPGESLEKGNVELPAMTWTPEELSPADLPYSALPRRDDGALFGYEIHRRYLREMHTFLKDEVGVKVPMCVTGRYDDLADLRASGEEMDFIGSNFYYDHPYWAVNKPAWELPSYFHNTNPLHDIDDHSLAAATSLARIKGKPFVVREWNYCWPNQNRSAGMVEAAAYGALHDFDAMILFAYETKPTARVSYFNVRSDPSRWGMVGICSEVFLKGLVQPSLHKIVVPYNAVDTFTYTKYHQPFYGLGWATRVENDFFDGSVYIAKPGTDLMVIPGRSGIGQYSNAPAVLHTEDLRCDLAGRTVPGPEYLEPYGMNVKPSPTMPLTYDGLIFDQDHQESRTLDLGLPLDGIATGGWRPIGTNEASNVANGFLDTSTQRLVFGSLEPYDVLRAALDAMQLFHDVPNSHDDTNHEAFHSDTGELFRDAASGRLIVTTPLFQALCGDLTGIGGESGGLGVRNAGIGTIVALSLDGRPLVTSQRYVIKMVTDARNVDQIEARDPSVPWSANQWKLAVYGNGPVTTGGRPAALPLQVSMSGRPLVDVYMTGGSWELYVNGDVRQFYCDTPGIRFNLHSETQEHVGSGPGAVPGVGAVVAQWRKVETGSGDQPMRAAAVDGADGSELTMAYPRDAAEVRVVG